MDLSKKARISGLFCSLNTYVFGALVKCEAGSYSVHKGVEHNEEHDKAKPSKYFKVFL
jgi:hypothetical protein